MSLFNRGRFIPDRSALAAFGRSLDMIEAMRGIAEAAASEAAAIAPVGATGDLAAGYEGEAGVEDGEAIGRVNGNDKKAGFYEYGTINNDAVAPLRRGCEAVGLEVKE